MYLALPEGFLRFACQPIVLNSSVQKLFDAQHGTGLTHRATPPRPKFKSTKAAFVCPVPDPSGAATRHAARPAHPLVRPVRTAGATRVPPIAAFPQRVIKNMIGDCCSEGRRAMVQEEQQSPDASDGRSFLAARDR